MKKFIGLVVLYYVIMTAVGIYSSLTFDLSKYNGQWTGYRTLKSFGNHSQFHILDVSEGTYTHSFLHPISKQVQMISKGKINKLMLAHELPNFQGDNTIYEISGQEYEEGHLISFCIMRAGKNSDNCDLRFRKK
ncbi:MAG TPA: hypothetical protein PLC27_05315 [Saprospiraceae bacterium]|jgi:hypothetical protein|nr:hypothetical protein [Saprospiraceae bacterium]